MNNFVQNLKSKFRYIILVSVVTISLLGIQIFPLLKNANAQASCDPALADRIKINNPTTYPIQVECLSLNSQIYDNDSRYSFLQKPISLGNQEIFYIQTPSLGIKDDIHLNWNIELGLGASVYVFYRNVPGASNNVPLWISNNYELITKDPYSSSTLNNFMQRSNTDGLIGIYDVYKLRNTGSSLVTFEKALPEGSDHAFSMYVVGIVFEETITTSPVPISIATPIQTSSPTSTPTTRPTTRPTITPTFSPTPRSTATLLPSPTSSSSPNLGGLIFKDDFEAPTVFNNPLGWYRLNHTNGTANLNNTARSTTFAYQGRYSLRNQVFFPAYNWDHYDTTNKPGGYNELHERVYMYIGPDYKQPKIGGHQHIMGFLTTRGSWEYLDVGIDQIATSPDRYAIVMERQDNNGVKYNHDTNPAPQFWLERGKWYAVEVASYTSATNGGVRVWINGQLALNHMGNNLTAWNVKSAWLGTCIKSEGIVGSIYYDNFVLSKSYVGM
ncbi:MAG: polysaccharide lyase [bacterium]|nr:polysaccharide lyase [bacterium]